MARDLSSKVVRRVHKHYEQALGYRTFRLADQSSECDENVPKRFPKWGKRLQKQIRSHKFITFSSVSVLNFLSAFKLACSTNGIDESAAIWIFHFFIKGSFAAALNACWSLKSTSQSSTPRAKDGMLRTYAEVVNYLLQTCATNDVIARTDVANTRFTQHSLCRQSSMRKP